MMYLPDNKDVVSDGLRTENTCTQTVHLDDRATAKLTIQKEESLQPLIDRAKRIEHVW